MMGVGKSTIGKRLAKKLKLKFIDIDQLIETREKSTIKEIFENKSENYFREIETLTLKKIIKEKNNFILSTGGGTPCFNDNMNLINKYGISIFLDTSLDILEERISRNNKRPLFNSSDDLKKDLSDLLNLRNPFFSLSNHTIKDNNREETLSIINSYS